MATNKIDYSIVDKTQQVLVTPELAAKLLAKNHSNRQLRKAKIKLYATYMRENNWRDFCPQPITVNTKEQLLDGQHRLSAIIETGTEQKINIYVESDTKLTPIDVMVDMNTPRNFSDLLCIHKDIVGTIRAFLHMSNKSLGYKAALTIDEIEDFFYKYVDKDEDLKKMLVLKRNPLWSYNEVKAIGMAFYLSNPVAKQYIMDLVSAIVSNEIVQYPILQKAYAKISERQFDRHEVTKLAMIYLNPECKDYKVIRIMPEISLTTFISKAHELLKEVE